MQDRYLIDKSALARWTKPSVNKRTWTDYARRR